MRYGMYSPMFLANEKGEFFCCHLGADFCAEHEWGIDGIKDLLGIPNYETVEPPFDISRFQITRCLQDNLAFIEDKQDTFLYLHKGYRKLESVSSKNWNEPCLTREKYKQDDSVLPVKSSGMWDANEFALYTNEENGRKYLKELYEAILNKDIAVMIGGGHSFQNGGLNLLIISKASQEAKETIAESLQDAAELREAAVATGIFEKVSKTMYYALSPHWKNAEKTEVHFWLNPTDQKNNNHGWYTVEDLELWLIGEGPIPIKQKKRRYES